MASIRRLGMVVTYLLGRFRLKLFARTYTVCVFWPERADEEKGSFRVLRLGRLTRSRLRRP